MGKASRRQRRSEQSPAAKAVPAPFVGRPFEGLPGETDWVALREIVPAATVQVALDQGSVADATGQEDVPAHITVTTVLPGALPGLHRHDGEHLLALQSMSSSGDVSRDLAQALLALVAAPAGAPVEAQPPAQYSTPRLQDLIDLQAPFDVVMHDGFSYWISDEAALDGEAKASLEAANESIIPTVKLTAAPSAYWCRVGDRTHLRWILPQEENAATDALARLHCAGLLGGAAGLGDGTRFLGAFRAGGLLAPVWDLDPAAQASTYEDALRTLSARLAQALETDLPLTADERRAKAGLLSRQLTLR